MLKDELQLLNHDLRSTQKERSALVEYTQKPSPRTSKKPPLERPLPEPMLKYELQLLNHDLRSTH